MSINLVVVESPAKAKTINKYLGKDYEVLASYGHVRDLIPKEGAVDPDNNFAMQYQAIDKNTRHVEQILKALKKADCLYLATDPDREGEAISWHISEIIRNKPALAKKPIRRVVFHEITKSAISEAMAHPRDIAMELVNAQQARRALDFLVGFNLSPLLWKKIRRGLSAGRVQSPALRMIVEREQEIEGFQSQEYWSILAHTQAQTQIFSAKLFIYQGEKLKQFSITSTEQAQTVTANLQQLSKGQLSVEKIAKKQRKRNPPAPFITSTLQQEAARKLGFSAQKTMRVAQQLYEGIELPQEGATGLITYMRTDSVNLAAEAVSEIRLAIAQRFGKDQHPAQPRFFKTKSKNAQEAHEAIRPTSALRSPERIQAVLSADQYKLYDLIYKRTLACQMNPACLDTVTVDLACGSPENIFRANGSIITDPGFLAAYQEGQDKEGADDEQDSVLPPLKEGDQLNLNELLPQQHFTEPPPRYSEASLIKSLEEHGIGRPSTYASIISTLIAREYVILEKKRFYPTDVGRIVNKFLSEYFNRYVDYDFTAKLEDELDEISRGEKEWIPLLESFWQPFKNLIEHTAENVQRSDVVQEKIDELCPKCGKQLSIRLGKRGRFIGCTGFPECDYTRNIDGETREKEEEIVQDRACPECGSELLIRAGKYGKFIGCRNYPKCKYLEPLEKPTDTKVTCPQCKQGTLLQRKSKRGKVFYSCSTYPSCQYAIWNQPLAESCPKCNWPILTLKITKTHGSQKVCPQANCGFSEDLAD